MVSESLVHAVTGGEMTEDLGKILSHHELKTLAETLVLTKQPLPEETSDPMPKVRYIATEDNSVLKIMGGLLTLSSRGACETGRRNYRD